MKLVFIANLLLAVALNAGNKMPASYKEIAKNRYQSPKGYEDTKKDFLKLFPSSNIKQMGEEINLPQVRAISFKNYEKNNNWWAANIYLNMQTGLTEIFFLDK